MVGAKTHMTFMVLIIHPDPPLRFLFPTLAIRLFCVCPNDQWSRYGDKMRRLNVENGEVRYKASCPDLRKE